MDSLQENLTGEDIASIKDSTSQLQQEVEKVSILMSQTDQGSDDENTEAPKTNTDAEETNESIPDSDSDVVDGDFNEV